MPFVRGLARISWDQAHIERPVRIALTVSILIVVRKLFDTHVTYVISRLGKLGMYGLIETIIICEIDVSIVIDVFSKVVVSLNVACEGMHCHHISRSDSISEELKTSRSTWFISFSWVENLRNSEETIISSLECTSVVVIVLADKFK